MTDLNRYNPATRTYTGTSGNDFISVNDIADVYPETFGFIVNGGPGNDVIDTFVKNIPRLDVINGEDGDDVLAVGTIRVTGGTVRLDGGRGADNAYFPDAIQIPEFRVGNQAIDFNLQSPTGSVAVRVFSPLSILLLASKMVLIDLIFLRKTLLMVEFG